MENGRRWSSFHRGTVSKTQFKKDLPVGFQTKCKRFATPDHATAQLVANQLRRGLTATKTREQSMNKKAREAVERRYDRDPDFADLVNRLCKTFDVLSLFQASATKSM